MTVNIAVSDPTMPSLFQSGLKVGSFAFTPPQYPDNNARPTVTRTSPQIGARNPEGQERQCRIMSSDPVSNSSPIGFLSRIAGSAGRLASGVFKNPFKLIKSGARQVIGTIKNVVAGKGGKQEKAMVLREANQQQAGRTDCLIKPDTIDSKVLRQKYMSQAMDLLPDSGPPGLRMKSSLQDLLSAQERPGTGGDRRDLPGQADAAIPVVNQGPVDPPQLTPVGPSDRKYEPHLVLGDLTAPMDQIGRFIDDSPTLEKGIIKAENKGWKIDFAETGGASGSNEANMHILVDTSSKDGKMIVRELCHELGHALYETDPYVAPSGLTREEYITRNIKRLFKEEAEATLNNLLVREEILSNSGVDIGISGINGKRYLEIYDEYKMTSDRETAREKIADIYADGEWPTLYPGLTYRQAYSQWYADRYDTWIKQWHENWVQ